MPARRRSVPLAVAFLAALAAALLVAPVPASAAGPGESILAGRVPEPGMEVVLLTARPGAKRPVTLDSTRSDHSGRFRLRYRPRSARGVNYLVATRGPYRLAAALGYSAVPDSATVNERTTVALGYAMAQFLEGDRVAGPNPGLRNAAAMTRNLVGPRRGTVSPVLARFPNGSSTSTLRSFGSLANLLASCRSQGPRCRRLLDLAAAPGAGPAPDTLAAVANLARYPWHRTAALYDLSLQVPQRYRPALAAGERPDAWTLALRFEGDGESIDGPGNFAIDAGGNLWVANNYAYSRQARKPACASEQLLRFRPNGEYFPLSPYSGGGLTGVGFGVTIDPSAHVWAGNFGFAGKGCEKEPPHNSVSEFNLAGEALSPDLEESPAGSGSYRGGWEQGEISWPQGTVSDRRGNIWLANCGNNSVTVYPEGNPQAAINYPESHFVDSSPGSGGFGFSRPFGIAVNDAGDAFVTANSSATVAMIGPGGKVLRRIQGGGLHHPLGIAGDSGGNMWVSNSTWVVAPCSGQFHRDSSTHGGSVTLIDRDGKLASEVPFRGGGLVNPWGIAVDGADHVWVANFGGRRLSELCGTRPSTCPPGKRRAGAGISPAKTGYGFDGLVRNTGVAVDPSGNVWLCNNWKQKPIQTNPGGYQVVAFLGLAAPVKAPLLGSPESP